MAKAHGRCRGDGLQTPSSLRRGMLTLLQVQRVTGEDLFGADLARQDLLVVGELDHRLYGLVVAS